jgi:hypothetical protein
MDPRERLKLQQQRRIQLHSPLLRLPQQQEQQQKPKQQMQQLQQQQ